jgi:hypothetical protein
MEMTHTNESVLSAAGLGSERLELPDLEIPILGGVQRQGDLLLVPASAPAQGIALGDGVLVVEAEDATGNSHILIGDGTWLRSAHHSLVEGWVTVPEGGEAFLIHTEEHNALGIGPGSYEIRRQREWDAQSAGFEAWARQEAADHAELDERRRVQAERDAYRPVRD